jgi:hypothetical protein
MRLKKSTDWDRLSLPYMSQMHSAPQTCRKDLAKLLGNVTGLVHDLANEEVELRRMHKESSPRQQALLVQIEQAIDTFEQWLMLAHLQHG